MQSVFVNAVVDFIVVVAAFIAVAAFAIVVAALATVVAFELLFLLLSLLVFRCCCCFCWFLVDVDCCGGLSIVTIISFPSSFFNYSFFFPFCPFLSLLTIFIEVGSDFSWFSMLSVAWIGFMAASLQTGFAADSGIACSNFSGKYFNGSLTVVVETLLRF